MIVQTKIRVTVVSALAAMAVLAACQRPTPSPMGAMSSAEQDATLLLTKWVGCNTVRRVSTTAGVDSTDVEICADTGARRLGPSSPPPVGKPVAFMRNLGDGIEQRWGLRPGGHYVVRIHGPPNAVRWTISGPQVNLSGPYRRCGDHTMPDSSYANFGSCAENPSSVRPPTRRGPAAVGTDGKNEHILLDRATGPAWVSCTDGCCTTDQQ